MSATDALVLLAAGGGAMWAYQRYKKRNESLLDRDERRGAEHDEDEVVPVNAPATTPVSTEPAQRRPAPSPGKPTISRELTHDFDEIFALNGSGLPVTYLRALGARESGLNPDDPKGLINVVRVTLEDYNARRGANLAPKDLKNPITSVIVAGDTLHRIIEGFARKHPDVANLREDWSNRNFVELLTFAWNAGPSESAGLGRVARFLESQGRTDVTLDDIVKNAYRAGAKHWLWDRAKARWTRSVADLYFAELDRDVRAGRVKLPLPPSVVLPPTDSPQPIDPYSEPEVVTVAAPPAQPTVQIETAPDSSLASELANLGRPVSTDVKAIVTSGWSRHRSHGLHRALDISLSQGTPVRAIADGEVVHVRPTPGGSDAGIWVGVRHSSGLSSRYLHLSKATASVGDRVRRGDVLGLSGNTGNSSGPHLHLDLRVPKSLLSEMESLVGEPPGGWGDELAGFGYSIPGEPWVPVDGYRKIVVTEAKRDGFTLYARVAPSTRITDGGPVTSPSQVDPQPTLVPDEPVSSPDQLDQTVQV